MKTVISFLVISFIVFGVAEANTDRSVDEKAIRAAEDSLMAAEEAGDIDGTLSHYTEDARIKTRNGTVSKEGLRKQLLLKKKGKKKSSHTVLSRTDSRIKFINPDKAVLTRTTRVLTGKQHDVHIKKTYVRRDGKWLVQKKTYTVD